MSFDLLVFSPNKVPTNEAEFLAWYEKLTKWDSQAHYDQLDQATHELQIFFQELSHHFPPLNPVRTTQKSDGWFPRQIRKFFQNTDSSIDQIHDDFDETYRTDYSIAPDAIYLSFAWSLSEKALRATLDAAIKSKVGFWHVSADNSQPIHSNQKLKALRKQLGEASIPNFTKADVFKLLKSLGWNVRRDPDDGSRSAERIEGDLILRVYPSVRQTSTGTIIDWGGSIVPKNYKKATQKIDQATKRQHTTMPTNGYFYPISLKQNQRERTEIRSTDHAKLVLNETLDALRETDIDTELEEVAKLPLSSPGNAPIRILAAKACLGQFFELCEIRDRMKKGDRQGLVPYITVEHLENAVSACAEIGNFP